ncbi:MAG TPA: ankyrin repeat domain-containing protein, partial [Candidatus Angelobacter sp.]|nr:ankyrin repeat domain-containing protein [Candidatus Angelobacter sp.]
KPIVDVNQSGWDGVRPIHIASYRGNLAEVEALVEGRADVNAAGDIMASTPLHDAAMQGHAEVIRFLLAHGAEPGTRDKFGHTPLETALVYKHADAAKVLEPVSPPPSNATSG